MAKLKVSIDERPGRFTIPFSTNDADRSAIVAIQRREYDASVSSVMRRALRHYIESKYPDLWAARGNGE